jgi:hypothetical protein
MNADLLNLAIDAGVLIGLVGYTGFLLFVKRRLSEDDKKPEWNPAERERLKQQLYNLGHTSEEVDEAINEYDETHERR